jgi:hypothetical protein
MINDNNYDLYATFRQCGGPHTLTIPHKKPIKAAAIGSTEELNSPSGPIVPVPSK